MSSSTASPVASNGARSAAAGAEAGSGRETTAARVEPPAAAAGGHGRAEPPRRSPGAVSLLLPVHVAHPSTPALRAAQAPELGEWLRARGFTPASLTFTGLGLVLAGVGLAATGVAGAAAVLLSSTLLTMGGGMAVLGLGALRRSASRSPAAAARLAASGRGRGGAGDAASGAGAGAPATVVQERARRVRLVLEACGRDVSFEELRARLQWTEEALVPTLAVMRDRSEVIEDLDLDHGGWRYRLVRPDEQPLGVAAEPSLDDRVQRLQLEERR